MSRARCARDVCAFCLVALCLANPASADPWDRLTIGSEATRFEDSDHFTRDQASLWAYSELDGGVAIGVVIAAARLRGRTEDVYESDHFGEISIDTAWSPDDDWTLSFEAGWRSWSEARSRAFGSFGLEWGDEERGLALSIDRADQVDRSDSIDALRAGLRSSTLGFEAWTALPADLSLAIDIAHTWTTDGNRDFAGELAIWFARWAHSRLGASAGASSYARPTDLYYSPEREFGGTLEFQHEREIVDDLFLEAEFHAGFGAADEGAGAQLGPAYGLSGSLTWLVGGFELRLVGELDRSQRGDAYTSWRGGISIEHEF